MYDWTLNVNFPVITLYNSINRIEKQQPRGFLRKRWSEKMQQIYGRTHMPKRDFNKVALLSFATLFKSHLFFCKFAVYFQDTFS